MLRPLQLNSEAHLLHATGGPARQGVLEVDGGRLEDAVLVAMHRLSGQKILRHLGFKISD